MKKKFTLGLILILSLKTFGQINTTKFGYVTGPINGLAEGHLSEKSCLLDCKEKQLTPCTYDRIGFGTLDFQDGIAVVIKDKKYGYINQSGEEIISCKFECALNFSEGLAAVKENSKWGFINKKGDYVISNIYDSETASFGYEGDIIFSKGFARVMLNGDAFFINTTGNKIKDCPYERVEPFNSGLAAVKLKDKWGFIDTTLSQIIPCIYDGTPMYPGMSDHYPNVAPIFNSNGLCVVAGEFRSYYTVIDETGKQLIPWTSKLIYIPNSKNYLSSVVINGKYGFINNLGLIEIPTIYETINFNNEFTDVCFLHYGKLLAVQKNRKYGYISKKGETIIPFIYDNADYFIDRKAKVQLNGVEFYIDENGNKIK